MKRRALKNWLRQLLLPGAALLLLLAGFSPVAQAAPSCLSDVGGPNDPTGDGQGDITRLCTDNANLPDSFDIYMSWDETAFSGKNTGDACALFDTDGDPGGNINYAICISVGGKPASLSAGPLIYRCNNSSPDRCSSPTPITPSGTTCSAQVKDEDPFPTGDDSPDDTVGVCTIDPDDIPPGAVRTNLCSFPSINPNSDPKDCVGIVGGGFITIENVADPDDGTSFSFTLDGQSYSISGSGSQLVSLASGQTYSVAEIVPANWQLSSASCVDNITGLPVGAFDSVNTITGLLLGSGDDFTCSFSNTKNFVDLVLAKFVNDSMPDEGDTIGYTLQLTNNGPVAATDIDVTDIVPAGVSYVNSSISGGDSNDDSSPGGTGLTWTVNSLASGSSTSLTFQATVDAGTGGATITNTASKTQTEPDADTTTDTPSVNITVNAPLVADLVTTKVVDDGTPDEGQSVVYLLTVTNNGPDSATNVELTDVLPGGVTYESDVASQGSYVSGTGVWSVGSLGNGANATLSLVARVDAGAGGTTITNTISAVSADESDPTVVGDDLSEAVLVNATLSAALTLVKSTTATGYSAVGDTLDYRYAVTNSGNVTLAEPVTIADDKTTASCALSGDGDLDVGETVICTAVDYAVTQADLDAGSVTNVATASAAGTDSNQDSVTVNATLSAALTLVKSTTATGYAAVGDLLDYRYAVTNSGNVTLAEPVTIADDKTTASCALSGDGDLDVGETVICTAVAYAVTQADLDAGSVTNVATASAAGTDSNQDSVTVNATASAALTLVKSTTATGYSAVGDTLDYRYAVTNSGNVTLAGPVTIADNKTTASCADLATIGDFDSDLDVGETVICTAVAYAVTQADLDAGSVTNLATASAAGTDSNQDSVTVNATVSAALTLVKSTTATGYAAVGDLLDYRYAVTNSGNVTLASPVTIADNKTTASCADLVTIGDLDSDLDVGETVICTAVAYAVTQADLDAGSVTNVATANAAGTDSNQDSVTVNATASAALTLVKSTTATGYAAVGDTLDYRYAVTNSGNVTLAGPVTIADNKTTASCADLVTIGDLDSDLDVGETVICTAVAYAVTQADLDAGSVTNVATANAAGTDSNQDSVTVNATLTEADLITTKVVDDGTPDEGQSVIYTLTVTNNGPDSATNVELTDVLPGGVTYESDVASQGSYVSGTGVWTLGSLANGASETLSITAGVDAGQGGNTLTNTITAVSASESDPSGAGDDLSAVVVVNVPPSADLVTTKVVDDGTPDAGQSVVYLLTVTNNGPDSATNVELTDVLPGGVTYESDVASQGSYVSGTGVWTLGSLANGASETLSITAGVDAGQGGNTLTNTITAVSASESDPSGAGDDLSAVVVVNVPPSADLVTTKVVDDGTPDAGQSVVYLLTVTNNGPDSATNVELTDVLPGGVTYESDVASQGSYVSGTGVWTLGTLANGASETLSITAGVDAGQGGNTLTNTITAVSASESDPSGAGDDLSAVVVVNVPPSADLVTTKVVDDGTPDAGQSVVYLLTVTNNGPDSATNVELTDVLPGGVTYESDVASQGSYVSGTGVWTLGSLANGASETLSITAGVDAGQGGNTLTNTITAVSASESDPSGAGDDLSAVVVVNVPPSADLVTTKVVDDGTPDAGQSVVYLLTVTNNGPDSATNVELTDVLPGGVTYESDVASQGSYVSGTGVWTLGTLANGASETLSITAGVDAGQGGNTLTNTITAVSASESDPSGAGDDLSAVVVVNVPPSADLVTTKVVDDGTPDAGQSVVYLLTVTNNGPDSATNVELTDVLPGGVTYESDVASQGSYVSGTGVWTLGTLANGAAATLSITARVDAGQGGNTITNTVTNVSASESDPTGVGDDYSEAVLVNVPAISAVNGMVWLDENHDDSMQLSEPLLPNWTVQLFQDGLLVDSTTTDNNGFYEFTELDPGAGYSIDFENPDNNVVWGQIAGLTLDPGVTSIDQSLPVDPQGVVYDSVSRNPLAGAVLTLVDEGGTALPVACFINANQQGQASTLAGQYRFDLVAGADPACPSTQTVYTIAVAEPAGYQSPPSATIAPQLTPLDPTGLGNPYLVVPTGTAPAGADPTTYYLSFALASGDPDVLNNHIPLDPVAVSGGDIVLSKSAAKREVSVGDMLFYTLTAENVAAGAVNGINLSDLIPGGFKYVKDSARLIRAGSDGELGTDDDTEVRIKAVGNRPVEFTNLDFAVAETLQVRYLLRVGAGVGPGEYVNRATPLFNGLAAGNTASAKVSVVADPVFDKTTVIGKVFHDRDGDGWQDAALASGLTVTADLDASVYIRESTRIERDGVTTAVVDGKGAPVAAGVKLGELSGRRSIADLPERHRVSLRIGMYSAVAPAIQVTTAEGTQVSIDAAGRQTVAPAGDVAAGRSGQDIVVERRVVAAEQGYDLVVSITNYGIEEAGIPGVRLATVGGLLIETDARGRYHIADVDPGKLSRGRNYILKADSATLPAGSEFTTENPRVMRITGGLMNKLNFGVRLPDQALPEKVARIRLGEVFFETDSELIKPANQPMLTKIANAIRHYRCGVISITGHTDDTGRADYNLKLGQRRADSVRRALGKLLDKSLMEQVDILVAPPPEQRSSLETLSTAAGRLLAGLVDMLVPVAHAEEHADCVSTACAEDSGVVIDIVSRGELEPRSSNATTQGRADNRRADVVFNGRLQLRDGGTVWATEDPAIIEPRLSVSGPAFISHSEGRFTQPAVFRLYSNYSHFIERWELGVYDASDTDLIVPLKTFSGNRLAYETGVEWNGETDRGRPLRAGDELVYMLRVFDADGRFDETAVASLYLGDPVAGDAAASTGLDETLNGYGESTLVRQTIPLSGSRVRIHGSDVPAAYTLSIDGEVVPVDSHGAFAVERILPTGEYPVDVAITDARNESWHRQLDVKVTGGYLFMVGIADLTVGENDFSGSDKALSDEGDEDGSVSDGRLAFYMKGKFAGKYRVTAQVDTTEEELGDVFSDLDRKDPDSVFRRLDPDRYYPTFGDDSTTTSDVDTQGRFYGRVEWDKSQALWGNFNTGITGNEYAQYDRSLYGGRMQYRDVDITRFGDHETELTVFGSEPNTAFAHNEFSGTGGSLYYLRNTDIVQGSEKVWVEVRERDTNRVLENITLQHGSDYQVDDIQGRIILNRPLAQVSSSAAPSIIKDQPLDGNDMLLMVDYEYVPDEFDSDRMTYGVRGKDWLTDRLGLGGTYVHEDRDGTNYELKGADVTLRHGAGTYIKAEYARSDARQTAADFASDDGGLSFSALNDSTDESVSGDAIKLEARVNHAEVTQGRAEGLSAVWWKHRDKGFSVARVDDGIDTTEYGAESSWQATENLALAVRGAVIDKEDDMEDRSLSAQADYRTNGPWTLSGELRYVSEDPDGESSRDATLAGAGVDYALAPGTSVYSTVQTAVSRDSDYAANNLYTLGVKARVGKRVTLNAEGSTGNRGEALQLGADYKVGSDYSMYTSYILSTDRSGGRKGVAVFGQRRQVGNSLRVFTEKQFSSGDQQSGLSSVYGLDFTPAKEWTLSALFQSSNPDDDDDGLERNAVSLGARYQGERLNFSNRLEYRRDRGDEDETQWLTANNLRFLINEEWTGVGKLNFSYSDNHDTGRDDGRFAEFDAGLAYRPVHHDRLNILSKYTYLYDLDSAGQQDAGTDQRSHVVSLEGIYDLNQRWELGSKLAWKRGEEREGRDEGRWFRTEKRLVVVRGRYHLTRHWDGLLEYRWLDVDEADDNRQGALLGIDRHINDHLKIGLGYNFTDFSDDLTDLDYQNNGWFLNFVGKL